MTAETLSRAPKGATIGLRVSDELRSALEAEAALSGRTMSQVAIQWLEQARNSAARQEGLDDLSPVGEVFRRLVAFADDVRESVGDPAEDAYAREALVHGWRYLIAQLPNTRPPAEYEARLQRHREVRRAAAKALDALRAIPDHNPTSVTLAACTEAPAVNVFAKDYRPQDRDTFADLLVMLAADDDGDALTPAQIGAREATANRLFDRMDGLLQKMGADPAPDVPFMDALGDLIAARKAEHEAQAEHARQRSVALGKANALLAKYAPATEANSDAR